MTDAHTHASIGTGTVLPVVESFYTVQGEGVNTGKAAWFIRLGGCDVRCPWCDSRNSWDAASFPLTDIEDIVSPITGSPAVNVVITGGEPLMHDLGPLCGRLKEKGYNIFLETSGTHPLSGVFDWICVSPKNTVLPCRRFWRRPTSSRQWQAVWRISHGQRTSESM